MTNELVSDSEVRIVKMLAEIPPPANPWSDAYAALGTDDESEEWHGMQDGGRDAWRQGIPGRIGA